MALRLRASVCVHAVRLCACLCVCVCVPHVFKHNKTEKSRARSPPCACPLSPPLPFMIFFPSSSSLFLFFPFPLCSLLTLACPASPTLCRLVAREGNGPCVSRLSPDAVQTGTGAGTCAANAIGVRVWPQHRPVGLHQGNAVLCMPVFFFSFVCVCVCVLGDGFSILWCCCSSCIVCCVG